MVRIRPLLLAPVMLLTASAPQRAAPRFLVTFPTERSARPLDGRLLLIISSDSAAEPRSQVNDDANTAQIFGVDVDGWQPGRPAAIDGTVFGYPLASLADIRPGRYRVQALLNRYETFRRADGHTVKLPPDKGEGQQWASKPGNLYSTPQWIAHRRHGCSARAHRARPGNPAHSRSGRTRNTSSTSASAVSA